MNNLEIVHHPIRFKLDDTCRTCGAFVVDGVLVPIFDQVEISTGDSLFQIPEELELMNIKISEDDNLPQQICINCINELKNIHLFRDKCKLAQDVLREYFIKSDIKTEIQIDNAIISEERQIISEDLVKDEKPLDGFLNKNKVVTDAFESDDESKSSEESYFAEESEFLDDLKFGDNSNPVDKESIETSNKGNPKVLKCDNCLYFAYKSEELIHGNGCTTMQDIFSCFYCVKSYKEDKEVINHIIETHPKGRPYLCPVCNKTFDTNQHCLKHVNEVHNDIKKPYHCDNCSSCFSLLTRLRKHKRQHHATGNYECRICHDKFTNIYKFKIHLARHNKDKPLKCKYCPKSFLVNRHLQDHEATHTGERRYHCKECDKTFKCTSSYYLHKRGHNKELHHCEICKKNFSKIALVAHMEKHKNKEDMKNDIRYLCSVCGKGYTTSMSLQKHLYSHNPSLVPVKTYNKTKKGTTVVIKKYDCSFCDEKLSSLLGLQNHLKMHDENRKYKCDVCSIRYKRKEHLTQHINSKHTKTKKYYCSFCNKVFVSCTARNSHQRVHLESKNRCLYCSKTFKTDARARQHERFNHTKEKSLMCIICNIGFSTYMKYKCHQAKQHSEEELEKAKDKILAQNLLSFTKQRDNIEEEMINYDEVNDS